MRCGAVKVDRATISFINSESKDYRDHDVGVGDWCVSLAAVVNQIAIALCRRAQAATEPDLHEQ